MGGLRFSGLPQKQLYPPVPEGVGKEGRLSPDLEIGMRESLLPRSTPQWGLYPVEQNPKVEPRSVLAVLKRKNKFYDLFDQ